MKLLPTDKAAEMLGFSAKTMLQSRYTGVLCGVAAPKHIKMGKSVRYDVEDLEQWVEQFKKRSSFNV